MLQNREGKKVPEVTFRVWEKDHWRDVQSRELFAGKKVVVFSLPGAFTPTCSSQHLPRYNELAPVFHKNGIDSIICISVNDTFVMNAWEEDQEAEDVLLVPDGNGEFTEKMGMLVDKQELGFGKRSWRYSMLVDDGHIEKMFMEPQVEGDPYEVSDADTMLNYINPDAQIPEFFTLFTRIGCPHCANAKQLLTDKELPFREIPLSREVNERMLKAITGSGKTPQVFSQGKLIGNGEALAAYIQDKY